MLITGVAAIDVINESTLLMRESYRLNITSCLVGYSGD